MAKQSLQIKRNREIFDDKKAAINHLNSIVKKLDDGEIVLCRYFHDGTIQTLVGFETRFMTTNSIGEEYEKTAIAYIDSFDEIGKGFFYDNNSVLQLDLGDGLTVDENNKIQFVLGEGLQIKDKKLDIKLNQNNDVKNFLHVDDEGMKVVDMDTDVTKTTEKILVMGGPLATDEMKEEIGRVFGTDDDDNPFIPADTSLQNLLFNLFCKEEYPQISASNSTQGNVTNSIKVPIITLSSSATTLEAGTNISISSVTFNGNSTPASTASTVTGLEYGYSALNDNKRDSNNKTITKEPSTSIVSSATTKMTCALTGFTKSGFTQITGTSVLTKGTHDLGQIIDGSNKITVSITGQPISYSIEEIPSVYPCSNIGKTSSACTTTKVDAKSNTLTAPTNNASKTITGVRYGFYGCVPDNFVINSANLRNLSKLTTPNPSSFTITGTNVVRVVVALPSTWTKKTIDTVKDNKALDAIVTNTYKLQTTQYDVEGANNYQTVKYNVYVYDPTDKKDDFKHTITLK